MPLAGVVAPPKTGAYLGVYAPFAPFDMNALASYEAKAGKSVAIVMWYQPWTADNRYLFDAGSCAKLWEAGQVPMITWEPWNPSNDANKLRDPASQPGYRLSAIAAGRYDGYIRSWARQIKALGGPVMLRPMHEMNGNWYPWDGTVNGNTPSQFVTVWRHVHDIFRQEGATNVTWVWSVNHESVPAGKANSYAAYYPGSAYVDWTAISGFNWGTSGSGTRWHTFEFWYDTPLTYLKKLKKPICVAEMASVEQGGSKPKWLIATYRSIRAIHQIKAVVYYDSLEKGSTTQDWRIDTTAASLAAFKKAVAPGYYLARAPSTLAAWTASLDGAETAYLATIRPVY
jgi:beta-mannanase